MADVVRPLDEVLAAIEKLRKLGATQVRVGDVTAVWLSSPLLGELTEAEPEKPKTPEEIAAERDRVLFASS